MREIESAQIENSFVSIFHREGREIPIKATGPLPGEMDDFIEAVAEFLWKVQEQKREVKLTTTSGRYGRKRLR